MRTISSSFGLLMALALPSCRIDTRVANLPLSISVAPAYVCPGDEVTVTWDAGEQDASCPEGLVGSGIGGGDPFERCIRMELTGTPTAPPWGGPGDHRRTQGSRSVAIETTNTFTVRARVENYGGFAGPFDLNRSATANVIDDTGPTRQIFSFIGDCIGATHTWNAVNLRDLLSRCVEVQQICNNSGDVVRLENLDAPGSRPVTLTPRACTIEFQGPGMNLAARSLSFIAPPGTCGEERMSPRPPPIQIEVQIACNRSLPGCPR